MGAFEDGSKRVLAVESGWRESTDSWSGVLRGLVNRGMNVVVSPDRRMVIVHRVDTDAPGNDVTHEEFGSLLRVLLAEHD